MSKGEKASPESLSSEKVRKFWENRGSASHVASPGLVNLENNPALLSIKEKEEPEALLDFLKVEENMTLLDLGAGYGQWSLLLAPRRSSIVEVDFVEAMLEKGRENAANLGINNIEFINCEAEKFNTEKNFTGSLSQAS